MMVDIFNHLWQSTIFAAVIAILCVACRRHRAPLRYALWFVASAKFLVPFTMLAAAGGLLEWKQAPAPIRSVVASPGVRDFRRGRGHRRRPPREADAGLGRSQTSPIRAGRVRFRRRRPAAASCISDDRTPADECSLLKRRSFTARCCRAITDRPAPSSTVGTSRSTTSFTSADHGNLHRSVTEKRICRLAR